MIYAVHSGAWRPAQALRDLGFPKKGLFLLLKTEDLTAEWGIIRLGFAYHLRPRIGLRFVGIHQCSIFICMCIYEAISLYA